MCSFETRTVKITTSLPLLETEYKVLYMLGRSSASQLYLSIPVLALKKISL